MSAEYLSKSTKAELKATAEALVASGKGILAADEAVPAMGQRFATIGTVTRLNSFLLKFVFKFTPPPFLNENGSTGSDTIHRC